MITLFELCGRDPDVRFSPAVWRTRFQLQHKGLDYRSVPLSFLGKTEFAASGSQKFPVIKDNETYVADSFMIAQYLDAKVSDKPIIAGGAQGVSAARFFNNWVLTTVLAQVFPMIAADVAVNLDEENAEYFRATREKALGVSLEEAKAASRPNINVLRGSLQPLRMLLKDTPFFEGETPGFQDYCFGGVMAWVYTVSDLELFADDDPLHAWQQRMLDLFDGDLRNAKRGVGL